MGGTVINHEWITGHPHEVKEIQRKALGHYVDIFLTAKSRKEAD
jgi:hypothetical protein